MWAWMLLCGPADAGELDDLLKKGDVSLVETSDNGRLKRVTAMSRISAPADQVWTRMIDFGSYEDWMPQVARSNVLTQTETEAEVDWGIKVPGPNVRFTAKYAIDPATYTVTATGVSGAVKGGTWTWKLVPEGARTMVYRITESSAMIDNWLVRQFDDDAHSLELVLNAASPLIEIRGLRQAFEE